MITGSVAWKIENEKLTAENQRLRSLNAELLAACESVEKWWLEDGMHETYGAPACIFQVRQIIAKAKEPNQLSSPPG